MSKELEVAKKIIKQTNSMLKKSFQRTGTKIFKLKNHREIVTEIDLMINDFIVEKLKEAFPTHTIISEEAKNINGDKKNVWYVDPIDGTTNFSFGFTEFSTCLGFSKDNELSLGVIGVPYMNEICFAEKESGAKCHNKKISVTKNKNLEDSFIFLCAGHSPESRKSFAKFVEQIKKSRCRFRVFASAGIELSAVASGQMDGAVMSGIKPWDIAAGAVLVREAGGRVTNFEGEEWNPKHTNAVASNGLVHDQILKMARKAI